MRRKLHVSVRRGEVGVLGNEDLASYPTLCFGPSMPEQPENGKGEENWVPYLSLRVLDGVGKEGAGSIKKTSMW
jgi:hypothetical protein